MADGEGALSSAVLANDPWWEFETATSIEGKVTVEAFDLAGSCTKHEAYSCAKGISLPAAV
jgi:hypothetical protein